MSSEDGFYQLSISSRFGSCDPQLQSSHVHHLHIVCDNVKKMGQSSVRFSSIMVVAHVPRARLTETALALSDRNTAASSNMILHDIKDKSHRTR